MKALLLATAALLICLPALAADEYVSALLMEPRSGQILFEDNADQPWVPASVVKLMLLLKLAEAVEEGRVTGDTMVIGSRYAQGMGGSQVYLADGERASFQKLVEAVAVGSANDAAVALAEHVWGDTESAVAAMNERAASLGMTGTRYVNVTGLPEDSGAPDNRTTARDQALLAREICNRHPLVLTWTEKIWTRFRPGLDMGTTNTLMKSFEGMDGLKTGYHDRARSNLVATAERDGRRFVAVVLGSPSPKVRNGVITRLLESGFRDWNLHLALRQGDDLGVEFPVARTWRGKLRVKAAEPLYYCLKRGEDDGVRIVLDRADQLKAPIGKGEVVGRIQVMQEDRVLSSVPALAARRMRASWFSWPAR